MPHIIVEYHQSLCDEAALGDLLRAIHRAVSDSGLFEPGHVRTRAYPFSAFTHGDNDGPYLHVQARIKAGRSAGSKQALSTAILNAIKGRSIALAAATVEIIDMDRDSYAKFTHPDA